MTQLTANFDAGVDGATIATTDPGNANAWDAVTILGASTTLKYSNVRSINGGMSASVVTAASETRAAYMSWTVGSLGTITDSYGRLFLFINDFPSGVEMPIMQLGQGTTRGARLSLLTDGKIQGIDAPPSADRTTSTNSIALAQWVRIEWHVVHSATVGLIEFKLFNTADSTSPTEIATSPSNRDTLANATRFDVGTNAGQTGGLDNGNAVLPNFDAIVAGATSYPGPVVTTAPDVLSMQTHVFGHGVW